MKFTSVVAAFVAIAYANAAVVDVTEVPKYTAIEKRDCGAAGSCHGLGGHELCNDRCKRCSGPTGKYHRGACCGFANQSCCCYYN
ncbi:hypothetical protein NQZ79_g2417 [Umbelopsis isabellina]|nr:hypothetical protein NQZ79_g2417 [Umbelopsis isabellina]